MKHLYRLLIPILLSLSSVAYSLPSPDIVFWPYSSIDTPDDTMAELRAHGWTITGFRIPSLLGQTYWYGNRYEVLATKPGCYFTFGTCRTLADELNFPDLVPQAEWDAFINAMATDQNFGLWQHARYSYQASSTLDQSVGDSWYTGNTGIPAFYSNDWVTDPNKFGFTTKLNYADSGGSPLASPSKKIAFSDSSPALYSTAYTTLTGHLTHDSIPTAFTDWFLGLFSGDTHATMILAEGGTQVTSNIWDNWVNSKPEQLVQFIRDWSSTVNNHTVITASSTVWGAHRTEIDAAATNAYATGNLYIDGVQNSPLHAIGNNATNCTIGNVITYYYPENSLVPRIKCHAPPIVQSDFQTIGDTISKGVIITQDIINRIQGNYFSPWNIDNFKQLSVGWFDPLTNSPGNVVDTKTDIIVNMGLHPNRSSSLATQVVSSLANLLWSKHTNFTPQCIIDSFVESTKQRSGRTVKGTDGGGYGVMNADAVMAYAEARKDRCADSGFVLSTPNLWRGYSANSSTQNGVTTDYVYMGKHGPINYTFPGIRTAKESVSSCTVRGGQALVTYTDPVTNIESNTSASAISNNNLPYITLYCTSMPHVTNNALLIYTNAPLIPYYDSNNVLQPAATASEIENTTKYALTYSPL